MQLCWNLRILITNRRYILRYEEDKNEDELKKKKKLKKKYKIFTDTSDNTENEETHVDTDKIGEKGFCSKDNFPDSNQPVSNEPHAEGHSKAPLLGREEILTCR